jgi:hypothetical protein
MSSHLAVALSLFVVALYLLSRPVSADAAGVITVLLGTALVWGANGILAVRLWRGWRRSRHDA